MCGKVFSVQARFFSRHAYNCKENIFHLAETINRLVSIQWRFSIFMPPSMTISRTKIHTTKYYLVLNTQCFRTEFHRIELNWIELLYVDYSRWSTQWSCHDTSCFNSISDLIEERTLVSCLPTERVWHIWEKALMNWGDQLCSVA